MTDPRVTKLANVLVNYSCGVKPGEKILIEAIDVPLEFTSECVRLARAAGADPLVLLKSTRINRALMQVATESQWGLMAEVERYQMERVQCYIGARGNYNVSELSDVPSEKQKVYETTVWKRVHNEVRVPKTRWVVLRWPHPSMAQLAGMSTEGFENFYFDVCTLDYQKMGRAMQALKKRMEATDRVHLKGPQDTDLTFSIKGIPAIPCDGKLNIPDGEVFTAPVRESVNGVIHFNAPTMYRGEFAFGVNPYITKAMKDILFDEKISGSIHFTPGNSYDEAPNGNKSEVHWDMVMIQTPEYGGGEIHFDGQVIRKDGLFVAPDLKALNPEALK